MSKAAAAPQRGGRGPLHPTNPSEPRRASGSTPEPPLIARFPPSPKTREPGRPRPGGTPDSHPSSPPLRPPGRQTLAKREARPPPAERTPQKTPLSRHAHPTPQRHPCPAEDRAPSSPHRGARRSPGPNPAPGLTPGKRHHISLCPRGASEPHPPTPTPAPPPNTTAPKGSGIPTPGNPSRQGPLPQGRSPRSQECGRSAEMPGRSIRRTRSKLRSRTSSG